MEDSAMKKELFASFAVMVMAGLLLAPGVCKAFSTEVYLTSDPSGAEVYLDGTKIGVTPMTVTVEGVAADHTLELRSTGCQSVVRSIYNIHPVCIPGCYPAVATEMFCDEELLEDGSLHLALERR
jgi:hypothetical protein